MKRQGCLEPCGRYCACFEAGYESAMKEAHLLCTDEKRRCICFERGYVERQFSRRGWLDLRQVAEPADDELERQLLGAMMAAPHAVMPIVLRRLTLGDFAVPQHRLLAAALIVLWRDGFWDSGSIGEGQALLCRVLAAEGGRGWTQEAAVNYVVDCLMACPFDDEEDYEEPLDHWWHAVTSWAEANCWKLAAVTFRRTLFRSLPSLLMALLGEEEPRAALRRLLLTVLRAGRRAAHRGRPVTSPPSSVSGAPLAPFPPSIDAQPELLRGG